MWYIYTMEYYTVVSRSNFYHLKWRGWTWRIYANHNKPVREGQIPYDLTYRWNLMNKNKLREK